MKEVLGKGINDIKKGVLKSKDSHFTTYEKKTIIKKGAIITSYL